MTFIISAAVFIIALISALVVWAGNQPGQRRCGDRRRTERSPGENRRNDETQTDPFGRPFFRKTVK